MLSIMRERMLSLLIVKQFVVNKSQSLLSNIVFCSIRLFTVENVFLGNYSMKAINFSLILHVILLGYYTG